jgi:hypothetical protein
MNNESTGAQEAPRRISDDMMIAMMPEGAKALLLAFGRCDLSGVLPESVEFLTENGLIDRAKSLNGTMAWIVTPEGKRVRKAIEKETKNV